MLHYLTTRQHGGTWWVMGLLTRRDKTLADKGEGRYCKILPCILLMKFVRRGQQDYAIFSWCMLFWIKILKPIKPGGTTWCLQTSSIRCKCYYRHTGEKAIKAWLSLVAGKIDLWFEESFHGSCFHGSCLFSPWRYKYEADQLHNSVFFIWTISW